MESRRSKQFHNPFGRPWMQDSGAATSLNKTLKGIAAGGTAGGLEVCISYPTEFVKTQLQLDEKAAQKKFDGIIDCVIKTVKNHGFVGLYRGLPVLIYGSIPKVAVRFGSFETNKSFLITPEGKLTTSGRLLSGLGAGVSEAIIAVTPMETIKVKFISDQRSGNPKFKGFLHGIKTIVKSEGLGGIYRGLLPTILRQGSNQMVRFYVMETGKDMYRASNATAFVPTPIVGVLGLLAGASSVLANNPIDVIKTRMQGLDAKQYKSSWDCAVKLWQLHGVPGFYKGCVTRLIRVMMEGAVVFMIYDNVMLVFDKIWPE